jgi:hypothetical protein
MDAPFGVDLKGKMTGTGQRRSKDRQRCGIHVSNPELDFIVNPRNKIILTDFLNRIFPGGIVKKHAFCGGKI